MSRTASTGPPCLAGGLPHPGRPGRGLPESASDSGAAAPVPTSAPTGRNRTRAIGARAGPVFDVTVVIQAARQRRRWATGAPPSAATLRPRTVRPISLHDTRTGRLTRLEPREDGRVGIYACGPTVYSRIHVGNARPFVVFSLFKRFLE